MMQGCEHSYNVTNVEYTEFEKLGISDECAQDSQYSRFPANTNVLYVGLQVRCAPQKCSCFVYFQMLPSMHERFTLDFCVPFFKMLGAGMLAEGRKICLALCAVLKLPGGARLVHQADILICF